MDDGIKGVPHRIADDLDAGVVAIVMPYELEALDVTLARHAAFLDYLDGRGAREA